MDQATRSRLPKLTEAFAAVGNKFPEELAAKFPRIVEKIDSLWGKVEVMSYLDSVLMSERGGRKGFDEAVLKELTCLKQLHEYHFPELSSNPFDPFISARFTLAGLFDSPSPSQEEKLTSAAESKASLEGAVSKLDNTTGLSQPVAWNEIGDPLELRQIAEGRHAGLQLPLKDHRRIGEILVAAGVLDHDALDQALTIQVAVRGAREPLGLILTRIGAITSQDLIFGLSMQMGIPIVDPLCYPADDEAAKRVTAAVAKSHMVVPIALFNGTLYLAVEDPFSFADRQYFAFLTNLNIEFVTAARDKLLARLNAYDHARSTEEVDREFRQLANRARASLPAANGESLALIETAAVSEDDSSIVGLVNKLIVDASLMGASDIHLEAFARSPQVRIRFRHDGEMERYSTYPISYHEAVVSRIKIMAGLDISERRRPQDGKITFPITGRAPIDLRIATLPSVNGIEMVTIRLLAGGEPLPVDRVGLSPDDMSRLRELMLHPYGLILVCGPTGSGKTTTLHSILRELNTDNRKIWTAEDPVEIVQQNICQVQINPKIDLTFANVLRAFLRADPDVIMIGEMRDAETARIAVEASMTGHLVLSTLHTNTAGETVARLLDLKVDPFNLSDAILGILAQRLARRICRDCGVAVELDSHELDELAAEYYHSAHQRNPSLAERDAITSSWRRRFGENGKLRRMQAVGCKNCSNSGYRGRVALFELLSITPAIRELVRRNGSAADFIEEAIKSGMRTLKQDGIEKVLMGHTDLFQVRSACI